MVSFKGLRSFTLFLCGLLISLPCGFTSGQYCASLYKAANFGGGDPFNLTEGSSFSDLEEEYLTADDVWKVTSSFQVNPGCTIRACNESYYAGECRDFTRELSTLPKPFENILSVSCSCYRNCSCKDVNNIRKNSCARAYVSEGGCNSCTPFYMEIKEGESDIFPERFEMNVTSLMVRPGCQLTVYDEQEFEGESHTLQTITERWTQPVRSYECSCDPEYQPPPRQREVSLTNNPRLIDIPDSLDGIAAMMNGEFRSHPGLLAALRSNRGKRSTKNAYILLLGTSGAGMSSTINMLLDNPNVTRVGEYISTTKAIHEYKIPVPVDELGIRNSELRVIDTPGLGNTRGLRMDAISLATLEEFLDSHEELKNRIPNVVLIFHKFSDNRIAHQGSQFQRTIRTLNLFRGRLTDKKYSNVIFVLSHFMSETKEVSRNPKTKLSAFKKTIEELSTFPRPIVLAVAENKAAEQDIPMLNGNYKLPNGDLYPKNLFDRIAQLTHGCGDTIGEAVFRTAFRNQDNFNITSTSFSLAKNRNSKITKYLSRLSDINQVEETELSKKLKKAHDTMTPELKQRFPDALRYLQNSFSLRNWVRVSDLPRKTPEIVKLLTELPQNEAVLYLLKEAFDISPPAFPQNILPGYGYNVLKDRPLPTSPFETGELQNSEIGYQFPSFITCKVDSQIKDVLLLFRNRSEYLDERAKSLNLAGKVSLDFSETTKPGHNVLDEITSSEGNLKAPITAVREFITFELTLNDQFTLTSEFKAAVRSLSPYNASDSECVLQWKSFFDKYGTHVVKSVYGGGAIQFELNTNKTFSTEIAALLISHMQFAKDISLGKIGNYSVDSEDVQLSLLFEGGEINPRATDLTKLPLQEATDLLETWKESLVYRPTILTSEFKLIPISEITKSLGQIISSEIERATGIIFNSSLTNSHSRQFTFLLERWMNMSRELIQDQLRSNMSANSINGSCLREGTLILMSDFTEKPVELLEVGETILDHNLSPVSVSGVLQKFLLTDSFHGFDNEIFFFTDTHLLIGRSTNNNLQIFTKELNKTLLQNPLISYLNVQELSHTTEILKYIPETKRVLSEEVAVFTDPTRHPPATPVYTILVEGESGTYFANGFVCRHDIPPLHLWPHTLSVLFSLASSPEIKWIEDVPYNLETIDKIQQILRGSYVRLLQILKEAEEGGIVGDGVAPEGLSLSDEVISEVFGNPSFSEFAVGIYATLGPTLADKLDVDVSIQSEEEIRRLQSVVYEGLKEYFAITLSHAFQLPTN